MKLNNVNIKKFYFLIIFSKTYEDFISKTGDKIIVHTGILNIEFHELLERIVESLKDEISLLENMIEIGINKKTKEIEISIGAYIGDKSGTVIFKGKNGFLNYVTIEY